MKVPKPFSIALISMCISLYGLYAQDTINHLIISEIRFDGYTHAYVELTNMHPTDSVFLGDFIYQIPFNLEFVQEGDDVRIAPGEYLSSFRTLVLPEKKLAPGASLSYSECTGRLEWYWSKTCSARSFTWPCNACRFFQSL